MIQAVFSNMHQNGSISLYKHFQRGNVGENDEFSYNLTPCCVQRAKTTGCILMEDCSTTLPPLDDAISYDSIYFPV